MCVINSLEILTLLYLGTQHTRHGSWSRYFTRHFDSYVYVMGNNNPKCPGQANFSPYSVDHKECIFVLSWQLNKPGRDARFKTSEVTGYYNLKKLLDPIRFEA